MKWFIEADPGSFAGVEAAAAGEGGLDWTGPVTPDHAACTVCFAAREAAEHIGRVAGNTAVLQRPGEPAVGGPVIRITTTRAVRAAGGGGGGIDPADLPGGEEAYTIRTSGNRCTIVGGGRVGALYGAYAWLKALGFDWFAPDVWDTAVPARLPRRLPAVNLQEAPSFVIRGFAIGTRRGGNAFPLWMARQKLNLWSIGAEDLPFCRKLGMKFSGGWHEDLSLWLDPKKYFDTHPEWFGMKDGVRVAGNQAWMGVNPCFSNPEVRRIAREAAVAELAGGRYKHADILYFSTADTGTWCECPDCRAYGTPTDHALRMVHEYRQAVVKARAAGVLHRDVLVGMTAYVETKHPPTRPMPEGFDAAGTFAIMFPIERCYAHTFTDHRCTEINAVLNTAYARWTGKDRFFPGMFGIGEYYNVSKFAGLAIPFTTTMDADIPYFHATGTRIMNYMHPVVSNLGTLAATNCQFAAQLWDHATPGRAWFEGFLKRRYGPHARAMGKFYSLLERAMCNCQALKHIPNFEPKDHLFHTLKLKGDPANPVRYFRSGHLDYAPRPGQDACTPSLEESLALVEAAGPIIDRVLLASTGVVAERVLADARRFAYTRNMIRFYCHIVHVRLFENKGDRAAAAEEARRLRGVGETLRAEDVVTRDGCQDSQVLFQNGLMATYLTQPYMQIMAEYGLAVDQVPFDGVT